MSLLFSKDGKEFFEVPDTDENAVLGESKGYKRYLELTKNGKDVYRVPADENVQEAFDKGYKTVGISKFLGEQDAPEFDFTKDLEGQLGARAMGKVLKPVGDVLSTIDSYTAAPARSAAKAFQEGKPYGEVLSAFTGQFGEDPGKSPTLANLYEKAGVSKQKSISFMGVENPFGIRGRFKQENISPSEALATATGFAIDPMNRLPGPNMVRQAGQVLGATGEIASNMARPVGRVAAHSLASVPPNDFNYYLKHHGRLKGKVSEGTDALRHEILGDVGKLQQQSAISVERLNQAQADLKNAAANLKQKMSVNEVIGPEDVDAWQSALENDKAIQGELSAQADKVLESIAITAPKSTLLSILDREIANFPPITPGNASARNTLEFIKNGVQQQYTDYLNGPQLRDWMRTVRKEIEYAKGRGEYVDDLDQALLSITREVSEALKGVAPEYKKIMSQMSQRIEATNAIAKDFSGVDQAKGLRALRQTQSRDTGFRDLTEGKLRNYATNNRYPELQQILDQYQDLRKTRENYEQIGYEQAPPFQDLRNNIADLELQSNEATRQLDDVRAFSETGTEAVIKSAGMPHEGKGFYKDQLQSLDRNFPDKNYPERIRDEGVLGGFNKERPNGARATLGLGSLGTFVGNQIAGPPGALLGGMLGAQQGMAMDKMGGKIARKAIDMSVGASNSVDRLASLLANPSPAMKPYIGVLNKAAQRGTQGLILYHHLLWNNDPEYRKAFSEEP